MTNEILIKSAIRLLVNEQIKQGSWGYALEEDSAYEVSWKDVLEWLEQQPNEDCISREAVLDYIEGSEAELGHDSENELVCQDIKALPSIIPQPKKGKWIKIEPYPLQMHEYKCSECGHETDDNTENYCGECGAKMEVKT